MTVHRSLSRTIRNKFIAGLVIVIPIVITVKALWWLFTYVDSLAAPLALRILGRPIPGIGFVITIAVVMLAGTLFSSGPLQRMLHGLEELTSRMHPDRGVLLLGAHVGSFEVLRVAAAERPDVKVRVVLDTQKTPALTELLHALNPEIGRNVIDASRPGTEIVLALSEALAEGALATLLADRARENEATIDADFFGAPAPFPTAPFLLGAILKVPIVLCLGMYRGGNRYDLHFEALADELVLPRREREAALREVVQRYATRLEHHVRQDPYNWFNWHDFWNPEGRGVEAGATTRAAGGARRGDAVVRSAG